VPRNDEGEFELVLGNRQILSVFFIVVVLLGVFFTMGYIVGRNSAPVIAEVQKKAEKPLTVEPAAPAAETEPAPIKETSAPKETAQQVPSETSAAEAKEEKPEAAPEPKATKPEVKESETKAERAKSEAPAKEKPRASSADQPIPGQAYLQLAATSKREAEVMVDVLRQKGFKSLAAEIQEKPGTWRVLVGPIGEGGAAALRADLQKSGFPGNAAIRRAF